MKDDEPLIPKYGGYRKLKSYRLAQVVSEVTTQFCDLYGDGLCRTCDRMIEASRFAVQRIAEGSVEGQNSKKMELKLTKQARVSLEELRRDYEGFLRVQELPVWDSADPRHVELVTRRPRTIDNVAEWMCWAEEIYGQEGRDGLEPKRPSTESIPPGTGVHAETMANGALGLITMVFSLLDRQVSAQTRVVQHEANVAERLRRRRLAEWPG